MKNQGASTEEKKIREAQTANYKKANWAFVIKLSGVGGGAGRMVKRGS